MRRVCWFVAAIVISAQLGSAALDACGAKFLVATRAPRFQRVQRATRPANILLYQHSNDSGVVEFVGALRDSLNSVGHKVTVVAGDAALRDAARNGSFTVVMLQLDEARRLKTDLRSWLPDAAILPMGAYVTRPAAAAAKDEFGQVLTLPAKTSQVFAVVQAAQK
jgi:hypothetical protein